MVDSAAGIISVDKGQPESETSKVTATGDTPWVLTDGIVWGQTRRLFSKDGTPAGRIRLEPEPGLEGLYDLNTLNRVLVRYMPDGTIREVMVDLTFPGVDAQDPMGAVPEKACEKCAEKQAKLDEIHRVTSERLGR
jgi:hypothetical protein